MKKEHLIGFNSTYMQFQRGKMRGQEKMIKYLVVAFCSLLILFVALGLAFIDQGFDNDRLEIENQKLQQVIIEKDAIIERQIDVINDQNKIIDKQSENFYSKLKDAIYDLSGNVIDKATSVIYLEAGNQGEKGMQLVADTIWNRKNSDKFSAKSISEVIKYPKQFNAITKINGLTTKTKESEQYLMAKKIVWDKVIKNTTISNEVLFFMNPTFSSNSSRGWFSSRELVVKHKQHEFYK